MARSVILLIFERLVHGSFILQHETGVRISRNAHLLQTEPVPMDLDLMWTVKRVVLEDPRFSNRLSD